MIVASSNDGDAAIAQAFAAGARHFARKPLRPRALEMCVRHVVDGVALARSWATSTPLAGDLRDLAFPGLLALMVAGRHTGSLTVESEALGARVVFEQGEALAARGTGSSDEGTLRQLALLDAGTFLFEPCRARRSARCRASRRRRRRSRKRRRRSASRSWTTRRSCAV